MDLFFWSIIFQKTVFAPGTRSDSIFTKRNGGRGTHGEATVRNISENVAIKRHCRW